MVLETIWFVLWGLLWAIYFFLDGFDLGSGVMQPLVAKSEEDRGEVYRAIGPFWDGNEVWLITAAGVTFAAFPGAYATIFSALYTPLMFLLFALILRGTALGLKTEVESEFLGRLLDLAFVAGSGISGFLFGVTFANLWVGLPLDQSGVFHGSLLTALNPYALLAGFFFLAFFCYHGLVWLSYQAGGEVRARAERLSRQVGIILAVFSLTFLLVTAFFTPVGQRYLAHPVLLILPVVAMAALVLSLVLLARGSFGQAFLASGVFILAVVFTGLGGTYPAFFSSTLSPEFSVTIHNAAASSLTLKIMLGIALVFVPAVILYQAWVYRLFAPTENQDTMK